MFIDARVVRFDALVHVFVFVDTEIDRTIELLDMIDVMLKHMLLKKVEMIFSIFFLICFHFETKLFEYIFQ